MENTLEPSELAEIQRASEVHRPLERVAHVRKSVKGLQPGVCVRLVVVFEGSPVRRKGVVGGEPETGCGRKRTAGEE